MHDYQETEEEISNSDIIKHTLMTLITVAKKTSDDYVWASTKKLLNELRGTYDFLKYISIDELELIKYTGDDIII